MIYATPVASVTNGRSDIRDDDWGKVISRILLAEEIPTEALDGIETFSHIEVIFFFDKVPVEKIERGSRHPRSNAAWPKIGIFAQRGKNRPNRLGISVARLIRREDRALIVLGLDAIDGTPVIDIKPVMREFLPIGDVAQPQWASELMSSYWVLVPNQSPDPTPASGTPPARQESRLP